MASGYRCRGTCGLTPTCVVTDDGRKVCPDCDAPVENVTLDVGSETHDPDERFDDYESFRQYAIEHNRHAVDNRHEPEY